ncbi:uncharacterized protein LOC116195355 [Punica granatum]|uniref:Uncharacterized protein LOC116195355 n=2 Tax=Punica granatum TaxID=22663 RepID=A0A6P8C9E4_PUNGR|nr:uncharacterized protein LOC116195355 [Punica granatum]XP_031380346.1 uncharacterized protein LOC116195355 [Punica granatum]XP_031380347.1 uncharacterized protein LOC116195355 [Punica granatum]PKI72349.1 hypothetical protein CRG98_007219 [Punica granatum]
MASGSEMVSATKQKTDPAWKHCQMVKNENSVHLTCLYCAKVFKGGGIHRMKEHLAGHKGNGSICLRVPQDVWQSMRESLEKLEPRRKRKSKGDVVVSNSNPPTDALAYQGDPDARIEPVSVLTDPIEPNSSSFITEQGRITKSKVRRKRQVDNSAMETSDMMPIGGNLDNSLLETPRPLLVRGVPDAANPNSISSSKRSMNHIDMAIGRFLFDIGAPLNAVNSSYFQPMIDAIASVGPIVAAPSYHTLRCQILKNIVEEVKSETANYSSVWEKTGCSLLVEQWNSELGRKFLSFSVHCPSRTVFLKGLALPDLIQSSDFLVEVLKQVVDEVGAQNVLQVITGGEEHLASAGKKLMEIFPTLYWAPCATQCIDLILEDFAKLEWINSVIRQAQSMTRFIYNHITVLNLMRKFTCGNDIVEPGGSQSAANFGTLKRMIDHKQNLQAMVTSEVWMNCPFSKKPEGLEILDTVTSQSFWSSCIHVTHLTNPLLRLRRIVGSEKKAAMGYVYAAIYRAREEIKKELTKREEYLFYWSILDRRWGQLDGLPLHAAGFYLNPKFFYTIKGDIPGQIMSGMFDCIERLVTDINIQDKIIKEMSSYKTAAGDFGRNMAIRARETLFPAEWWSTYGGGCPNLKRLAIRVLGQTCSADVCKSLQIPFDQVHEMQNSLEHQRLSDLLFAQCNLRLRGDKNREYHFTDPLASDTTVVDWVTGKDFYSRDCDSLDWNSIDPPSASPIFLGKSTDETEDLGAGFDDYEIFDRVKDEENAEENAVTMKDQFANFVVKKVLETCDDIQQNDGE